MGAKVKKKTAVLGFISMCMLMAACGGEGAIIDTVLQQEDGLSSIIEELPAQQAGPMQEIPLLLYYGNETADGLAAEEVFVTELTSEELLEQLCLKNIVSVSTQADSCEIRQENDLTYVYLDLSRQFKEYLNLMGTDGEYIIIGSLTNTFLDAFQAEYLVLTVEGQILKTQNALYDEPLKRFELMQAEAEEVITYTIHEEVITDEKNSISYPQFADMKDRELMAEWNDAIMKYAIGNYSQEGLKQYTVTYEIATMQEDMLSIVLRGECIYENGAGPFIFPKSLNFDLSNGQTLRLKDFADIGAIIHALESGQGYQVLEEDVTSQELLDYFNSGYIDDYTILFLDYDYDHQNPNLIATGFSYLKDGKVVLIIGVNHAMGDYLEVQFDDILDA